MLSYFFTPPANRPKNIVVFCALASALSGCSRTTNVDVTGNYQSNNPYCSAQITLQPDGKYSQAVVLRDGKRLVAAGQWQLTPAKEELSLSNAVRVNKDSTTNKIYVHRGAIRLATENIFGATKLIEDSDANIYYSKTKSGQ